jgi:hypothetical protein
MMVGKNSWRFSLRTLFVLVTVLGIALGWVGVQVQAARRQRHAVEGIRALGGEVWYDYDDYNQIPPAESPWPEWLVRAIGIDYFATVTEVTAPVGHEQISQSVEHWRQLPHLRKLHFVNTSIWDERDPVIQEVKRSMPGVKINIAWSDQHIGP